MKAAGYIISLIFLGLSAYSLLNKDHGNDMAMLFGIMAIYIRIVANEIKD